MRIFVTTVIVAAVVAATAVAPAASADTLTPITDLPDGDRLIVTDCDANWGQAYTASVDGAAVPLGSPAPGDDFSWCGRTGAVHPQTGIVYWVSQSSIYDLLTLDLTTGTSSRVGELTGSAITGAGPCGVSIDSSGTAYTSISNELYEVDLDTAEMTLIGDTGLYNYCAWGINPVDDKIYWFTRNGPSNSDVYRIDKETGVASFVVSLDVSRLDGYNPDGVVFDRRGIAWIQDDYIDIPFASSRLEPANLTTGIVHPPTGYFHDATGALYPPRGPEAKSYFYTMGLIYVPAAVPDPGGSGTPGGDQETLASTGVDDHLAAVLAFAILAFALGATLTRGPRHQTTAE